MAKPIAGINDYRYGICGFVVDGALLTNGTKLKNLRIYKQRSIHMFDLIDPVSGTIYQKIQLTGLNTSNLVLDYNLSDDELLNIIPNNSCFVRGYNSSLTEYGFVIRFLNNKVVLSGGRYLYDMYTPECNIPNPNLGVVTVNTVTVDSTTVSGSVSALVGSLKEDGMIVTLTTPEGLVYTTTVINRVFTFENVVFSSEGTGTIVITSPHYNTSTTEFTVQPSTVDTAYVSQVPVAASEFVLNVSGTYTYSLPESIHQRGNEIVVQIQDPNGVIYNPEVVVDSSGNITITQIEPQDLDVVIIGPTNHTSVYSTALAWMVDGDVFAMYIPFSTHGMDNASVSVYDGNTIVQINVQIDEFDNITLTTNQNFVGKIVIAGK